MHKALLVLALATPLALSGCVIAVGDKGESVTWQHDWEQREQRNRENLNQLNLGMSTTDVRDLMGTADFNESLSKADKRYQLLYYRTQRLRGDGTTSKDECTPLVFEEGKLIGWGDKLLESI